MSSTPRRCHADVGLVEDFTRGRLRIWAMCSSSASSLARQGARVAHVFVATSINASCTRCTASPVRTAAVPMCIEAKCSSTSAPTVPSAAVLSQLALAFTQLHPPRAATLMVSTLKTLPSRRPAARSFNVESLGPVLHRLGAGRAERFVQGRAALGRRRFAPPRRAPVAATDSSLAYQRGVA